MCRSIKTLRTEPVVTGADMDAAALQYVRKISGFRQPSQRNREAFERAVAEVSRVTAELLEAVRAG